MPHESGNTKSPFSLTPCFSRGWQSGQTKNRVNGLPHYVRTVETVPNCFSPPCTQLKRGVNERTSFH
jgi:hypothetical protein